VDFVPLFILRSEGDGTNDVYRWAVQGKEMEIDQHGNTETAVSR
jgi:hypothetical protein